MRRKRKFSGVTSRFKGVFWQKNAKQWQVQIYLRGVHRYLGLYDHEQDAADAYDTAAAVFFGKSAITNKRTKH